MSDGLPKPQYSIWNAISAALAAAIKALEEVRALSREPGPQGERGERGKDAIALADIKLSSPDGGRTIVFSFKNGQEAETIRELKTWAIIDQGIWREEKNYEKGDFVSWASSGWIAQDSCIGEKPGIGATAWRLAVKRGRDGKDGQSIQGPPGPQGRPGRDLTQMGPDGVKF